MSWLQVQCLKPNFPKKNKEFKVDWANILQHSEADTYRKQLFISGLIIRHWTWSDALLKSQEEAVKVRGEAQLASDFVSEELHGEVLNSSDFRNESYTGKLWIRFHLMCAATCGCTDCMCVCVCVGVWVLRVGSAGWIAGTGRRLWCGVCSAARWGNAPDPDHNRREDTCHTSSETHTEACWNTQLPTTTHMQWCNKAKR